ncbi:MAG: metal ABC transporter substrate-binding protein [Anaerolineales bacterium]
MRRFILLWLFFGVLAGACRPVPRSAADDDRLLVLASTSIIADVVRQVGGEDIRIAMLLPPDTDVHAYTLTAQDMINIAAADVVFLNGLGLELPLRTALENIRPDAVQVDLSQGITPLSGFFLHPEGGAADSPHEGEASSGGAFDPHVWTDPTNVAIWVQVIAETLAQQDTAHAEAYRQRAEVYRRELATLDVWIDTTIGNIPPDRRVLVGDHAVWGYFAARYGFKQQLALVPGYSTLVQPSAQELAALEAAIQQYNVPVIFVGNTVNPALAERVAADTGTRLAFLYTDALSAADGPAATYLDWMRYNVTVIANGFSQP